MAGLISSSRVCPNGHKVEVIVIEIRCIKINWQKKENVAYRD
jgi:hypothetical protein